jgi:hypothetical protein
MVLAFLTALLVSQATGSLYDGPIAGTDTAFSVTQAGSPFTALPLNALQTTDGIKVKGFRWVEWTLRYTFGAATAVTMQCDQSEDGLTWAFIPVLTFTGPIAGSAVLTWSQPVTATTNWVWTVPNHGVYMRCKFLGTGATSSDKMSLTARAGV